MMKIIAKFALTAVMLAAIADPLLFAQAPSGESTQPYISVGRIKWNVPPSIEHTFGVPHFTMGPRILCKGQLRHCEISVGARDITIDLDKRRADLTAKLEHYASRSKEKQIQIRTFGTSPEVFYVTLTDTRPAPGEFVLLTEGFSVNGTAVINFLLQSNDPNDVPKILEIVQSARPIDALEMWAWKLGDYKSVCAERFPEHQTANDAAFKASPFASIDPMNFWMKGGRTREQALTRQVAARKQYADIFEQKPPAESSPFAKTFPSG